LVRYTCRPPIATERLSLLEDGRVAYKLRRPFSDGTWRVVFSPLTFIEKLSALVPWPRANLLTYHGVLAGASHLRPKIVPRTRPRPTKAATLFAPLLEEDEAKRPKSPLPVKPQVVPLDSRRYSWAQLMLRVFEIDVLRCPCGARREVIATITDPPVVRKILEHLGLDTDPPRRAPARPPPQTLIDFDSQQRDPVTD
jgi:hypothetical protein